MYTNHLQKASRLKHTLKQKYEPKNVPKNFGFFQNISQK